MICTPTPKCGKCPFAKQCEAHKSNATDSIPPIIQRLKPKESKIWLVAVESEGHWLLCEPTQKGLLAGLWKWPTVEVAALGEANMAADANLPYASSELCEWPGWIQVYTHRREIVSPLHLRLVMRFDAPEGCRWIAGIELDQLALGKRDLRLRELIKGIGTVPLHGPTATTLLTQIKGDAARVR